MHILRCGRRLVTKLFYCMNVTKLALVRRFDKSFDLSQIKVKFYIFSTFEDK